MNHSTSTRSRNLGFTIVELVVVIVVIGILAAITVVAYNGIQKQARTAATLSAVDAYEKLLRMYKETYGYYPDLQALTGYVAGYACLGGPYEATADMGKDVCYNLIVNGSPNNKAVVSSGLNDALTEFSTSTPQIDTTEYHPADGYGIRGVMYSETSYNGDLNNQQVRLYYAMGDGSTCGRGKPSSIGSVKMCALSLQEYAT